MACAAVVRVINWKDIFVWPLHPRAVVPRDINKFPEDRRSSLSMCQAPNGQQMREHIEQVRENLGEKLLAAASIHDCLYDDSSNVDWSSAKITLHDVEEAIIPGRTKTSPSTANSQEEPSDGEEDKPNT